jgi:hypothetical protein
MLTSFKALTKIAPFGKLYRVTCRSSDIMKIVKVAENGKNFECKSNRPPHYSKSPPLINVMKKLISL